MVNYGTLFLLYNETRMMFIIKFINFIIAISGYIMKHFASNICIVIIMHINHLILVWFVVFYHTNKDLLLTEYSFAAI